MKGPRPQDSFGVDAADAAEKTTECGPYFAFGKMCVATNYTNEHEC